MSNREPDDMSDLPDNFNDDWNPDNTQADNTQSMEDYELYLDEQDDLMYDAQVWESAYGPSDDGGWSF